MLIPGLELAGAEAFNHLHTDAGVANRREEADGPSSSGSTAYRLISAHRSAKGRCAI
jgi:hypothetical protein